MKRNNGVSLFLYVIILRKRCLLKTSLLNQQKFLQNEGILVLGNMPIGLFKRRNDSLENLSVNPCSKRRNAERVIWDHRRGEHKSPPYSLNIAPTTSCFNGLLKFKDWLKSPSHLTLSVNSRTVKTIKFNQCS